MQAKAAAQFFGIGLLMLAPLAAGAQTFPTAVYTLADHHAVRWAPETNPLSKIAGACRISPAQESFTLTCAGRPSPEPREGRRHFFSIVLFRDLEETLYQAACAATTRDDPCEDLRAGQTFSAEVAAEDRIIRIVHRGQQFSLRILEMRPRPVSVDSPARGTPSNVRPSTGTPSAVPYSQLSQSRGTPSSVVPSAVEVAAGAPSLAPPSEVTPSSIAPTSARLYVYCSTGSARVFVDNQPLGAAPLEIPLIPGRHTVLVRAPGYRDWARNVQLAPGETVRVTASLGR